MCSFKYLSLKVTNVPLTGSVNLGDLLNTYVFEFFLPVGWK